MLQIFHIKQKYFAFVLLNHFMATLESCEQKLHVPTVMSSDVIMNNNTVKINKSNMASVSHGNNNYSKNFFLFF